MVCFRRYGHILYYTTLFRSPLLVLTTRKCAASLSFAFGTRYDCTSCLIEHFYSRDREKIGAGLRFCKRNGEQSEFLPDNPGAVGRYVHGRPYVRGEEALAAKLLVAALRLAVRRKRQLPPLARLLELKMHDRCHRIFGFPGFWHPRARYPSLFCTPAPDILRIFGTLLGFFAPPIRTCICTR